MSVIVQPSIKGFDLSEFGNAEEQANWLLENDVGATRVGKRGDVGLRRRNRKERDYVFPIRVHD